MLALAARRRRAKPGVDHHRSTVAIRPLATDLGLADFGRGTDPGQLDVFKVGNAVAIRRPEEHAWPGRDGPVTHQGSGWVLVMIIDMKQ
ncbi:hypothetical protein D3C79_682330 [compost metagenome]